jgi:tetratricopeptide (TPR) repeat protein
MKKAAKRNTLVFLFAFLAPLALRGVAHFHFNQNCLNAHGLIYNLQLDQAAKVLNIEAAKGNLAAELLTDYSDFLRVFIQEDQAVYKNLSSLTGKRITRFSKLPENTPWRLYAMAEVKVHWGLAAFKFKEYWSAFTFFRNAWSDLRENQRKFPDFVLNNKSLGLLEAAAGSIPDAYKGFASLLGYEGNLRHGLNRIEQIGIRQSTDPNLVYFHREALLLATWLRTHLLNDPEGAWNLISNHTTAIIPVGELFVLASTAMHAGRNDRAISMLSNRQTAAGQLPFYYLDYMQGMAMLRNLDTLAEIHFKKYLVHFKGRNFIKAAARNLAWIALLKNDKIWYANYLVLARTRGYADSEEDKQALNDAWRKEAPDIRLLRSRLLSDGAYYDRALAMLSLCRENEFQTLPGKVEYLYRMGRLYEQTRQIALAERYYLRTMQEGVNLSQYFAANAALHLGLLYEQTGRKSEAAVFFRKAISGFPNNTEYRNGIEQKARAGLQRLRGG